MQSTTHAKEPLLLDYLSPSELAAELKVKTRTVDRWRAVGIGPPITKVGRKVYYKRTAVAEWLQSCQAKDRRAA